MDNKLRLLLEEELEWERLQEKLDDNEWRQRGIKLYKKLCKIEPREPRYKRSLAKLLMSAGRDEKTRKFNYMEAERLFNDVLELFGSGDHALKANYYIEAHYRLGCIKYIHKKYDEAVRYFKIVLEADAPTKDLLIKTLCYCGAAYISLGEKEKGRDCFRRARDMVTDGEYSTFLEMEYTVHVAITENKPFILYSKSDGEYHITINKANEIADLVDEQIVVLDMRELILTGPKDTTPLSLKEVLILQYLMKHHDTYLSSIKILDYVWEGEGGMNIVKVNISRLRNRLKRCFHEPINDIIISKRGYGYRWNYPGEFYIIQLASMP